jgi:hypothetical protein
MRRDGCALDPQVPDHAELDQAEAAVDPLEVRDRGVAHHVRLRELEQFRLGEPEEHVERHHHHRVVRHDERPLARRGLEVGEERAQPERHVGPRFAAGRPVVELAEMPAAGELAREPRLHPRAGQQVEHAELAIADALIGVHDARLVLFAECHRERLAGARVRRAPQRVDPGKAVVQPATERLRLLDAGGREGHVGIAEVERDHLRALGFGAGGGDVADALPVPGQPQLSHHVVLRSRRSLRSSRGRQGGGTPWRWAP